MIHSTIMNTSRCQVIRSLRELPPCFYSEKTLPSSSKTGLPPCRPSLARERTTSGPSLPTSIIASMGSERHMLATLRGVSVPSPFHSEHILIIDLCPPASCIHHSEPPCDIRWSGARSGNIPVLQHRYKQIGLWSPPRGVPQRPQWVGYGPPRLRP